MPKYRDLVNQRFGKLTVIEKTDQLQDRYAVWRCVCDCGGEILVNTKRLLRGTVTNCGCVPETGTSSGRAAEDLTGQVFGDLTVLSRAESQKGRTCWLCRCNCGKETVVAAYQLKSGKTRSCGCRRYTGKHNEADITNQRFGRLIAEYPTAKRDKKGSVFWHCRCDCGNEVDVTQDGLVYGTYRSCGCRKREIQENIGETLTFTDNTCIEWLEKRKSRCDNTSGFRGVYLTKTGRYRALIGFKKQRFYIGSYKTFEEAVQARLDAEETIHAGFVKAYRIWSEKASADAQWAKENPLQYEVIKQNGVFLVLTNVKDTTNEETCPAKVAVK
ncbi:MAG: hypothetical protein ACOX7K_07150 [Oscillospiraceae bacterium]|jgi:hypothetical protein